MYRLRDMFVPNVLGERVLASPASQLAPVPNLLGDDLSPLVATGGAVEGLVYRNQDEREEAQQSLPELTSW